LRQSLYYDYHLPGKQMGFERATTRSSRPVGAHFKQPVKRSSSQFSHGEGDICLLRFVFYPPSADSRGGPFASLSGCLQISLRPVFSMFWAKGAPFANSPKSLYKG
jgi:hypothetical protein